MKNLKNLGKALTQAEQKTIIGGGLGFAGLICCEWCSDGSCNGWTYPGVRCPIAATC